MDVFIPAWKEGFATVQKQLVSHLSTAPTQRELLYYQDQKRKWPRPHRHTTDRSQGKLIIFDSLATLTSDPAISPNLPALLSSFITPTVSLLSLHHADIPISTSISQASPYSPQPLTVLKYLATTIMTTHSLSHVLARKAARERSVAEPVFGLEEDVEGVLVGLGGNGEDELVLEMEYRRKSGRGVREWYFVPSSSSPSAAFSSGAGVSRFRETAVLLEDHPLYRRPEEDEGAKRAEDEGMDVTFELGLTEKQRRDREGVVLPYFDAQKGGGEGGRILYDMGVEDDFDEEEDEI